MINYRLGFDKLRKYALLILVVFASLYILTIIAAYLFQKNIHKNYGIKFNDDRFKVGLYPIKQFESMEHNYWEDFYPDDLIARWITILTNEPIDNPSIYYNSVSDLTTVHRFKQIHIRTQLFFWENAYLGEMDLFVKPIDSNRNIQLLVTYYSSELCPDGYFYANIDTVYKIKQFQCGRLLEKEDFIKLPIGNLTKNEADKVLQYWEINIK